MEDMISEPEIETVDEATAESVDNMSESELDELFETPSESDENSQPEEPETVDVESLYTAQMEDPDLKLDKPIYIKVNGKVIEVDSVNDLKNMAELGTGAQQKFKTISAHKDTLQFMEDNGISREDLDALVVARGQEPVTVDTAAREVEEVATQILQSPIADDFKAGVAALPAEVKTQIGSDANLMSGLAIDFQSGLAQTILPHVHKEMVTKGMDFVEAYVSVGKRLEASKSTTEKQKTMLKAKPSASAKVDNHTVDVWEMDDAEFDKYFETV